LIVREGRARVRVWLMYCVGIAVSGVFEGGGGVWMG